MVKYVKMPRKVFSGAIHRLEDGAVFYLGTKEAAFLVIKLNAADSTWEDNDKIGGAWDETNS